MRFEKGNSYGRRFSSENQPKKNGRKPSLYKQIRKLTGKSVGHEMGREDYFAVIRFLMEQDVETLRNLSKGADGKAAPGVPIWVLNIISAINTDVRYGRTTTLDSIFDRIFGKATQPIEGSVDATVSDTAGYANLSTDELDQYRALLEKMRSAGGQEGQQTDQD